MKEIDLNMKIKPRIGAQRLVDKFPERVDVLIEGIAKGMTYGLACKRASIRYHTFASWMKKAEEGDAQYIEIYERVRKAEADAAYKWIQIIDANAESGTWQAAAWLLERRYAKEYGRDNATRELMARMEELIRLYNAKQEIPANFLDSFINCESQGTTDNEIEKESSDED